MQLSQMWREHLQAGCPPEMRGLNIAGTAASALDAEITACVSACVTHSLEDGFADRAPPARHRACARRHEGQGTPEVAAYCIALNKLVSAVLVNAGPGGSSRRDSAGAARTRPADTAPDRGAAGVRPTDKRRPEFRRRHHFYFGSNFSDTPFMQ